MGLQENMRGEPVSSLALRKPVTASADTTIREASRRMTAGSLGCIVIVDEAGKPIGMFTESMLTQLLAHDPKRLEGCLADEMAPQWPYVKLTDPIEDVLEALHLKNVRFLCVVDDEGRLVGLTGQKGLMEYVADHFPGQVMVQRIGGTPFLDKREGA